jgi:hypothetical protein
MRYFTNYENYTDYNSYKKKLGVALQESTCSLRFSKLRIVSCKFSYLAQKQTVLEQCQTLIKWRYVEN